MATIVTRSGKGSPLTNAEVDGNFTNLNTELGTKVNASSLATVATSGAYADLTGKPALGTVATQSADNVAITGGAITGTTMDSISNHVGADHIHYKVKATEALAKGNVVKVVGFNAGENAFEVAKVTSASDIAVGVVYQPLASGAFGAIINTGLLEGIDTSAFSIGTVLYPNTSGGFTSTKPTTGRYQALAFVVRSHANNGTILIEASEPQATSLSQFTNDSGYITGITSGNVTTALGYTPANISGPTFSNGVTVNNGGNQVLIAYDGNLEIVRAAGNAYIDFKDSASEDFDVRLQASGNQLNIAAAGGLTLNGAGVLTGITSGQVTTALGFTPYNATNPAGYITSSGSISGNAATATNISNTGTVTLASATESNSIYATSPSYGFDQPVKLLNFDWYGNVFSLGNIRSADTPSSGFGVYYTASGGSRTELARFLPNGNFGIGTSSVAGRLHSVSTSGFVSPTLLCGDGVSNFRVVFNTGAYAGVPANKPWLHSYDDIYIGSDANVTTRFMSGGATNLAVASSGIVTAATAFNAPIFTDSANSAYYVDPASTSNLNKLTASNRSMVGNASIFMDSLDANTYYPVTIPVPVARQTTLRIENALNSNAPSWSTHPSGFSCYIEWTTNGLGWGTIGISRRVTDWREQFATVQIVGGITHMGNSSQEVIWLRGGANYFFSADCDVTPTVRTTSYESLGQTVAPRSSPFNDPRETAIGKVAVGSLQTNETSLFRASLITPDNTDVGIINASNNASLWVDDLFGNFYMKNTIGGFYGDFNNYNFRSAASGEWAYMDGNMFRHSASLRAPIFYDSDNTAYYVDPNGNSVLNTLYMRNGTVQAKFAQASNFGYSSSYKTVVLGNEYLTTISMGVDVSGNASGSFNGQGEGREVLFRNGVSFITPNAANTNYLNVMQLTDGVANFTAYATAAGSFRAPIFYDSNNTAYYVDPNGGSRTGGITADSLESYGNLTVNSGLVYRSDWTTRFQSLSDFTDGTLVTTDIPATGWAGDSFVIEITGKSYDQNNPPFKVVAQGYLYNDTIINYSGISYAGNFASYIKVFQDGGVLKFWWPRISYWNSFNVNVMSMDGQTNGTITRNRVTAIGNSTEPTGTKKQQINLTRTLKTGDAAGSISGFNNPTTAPTANTIVYRDGLGDIAAREIILSSGLSAQTPTVLVSMYPTTNQMVRTTPAAVSAAIQGAASGIWNIRSADLHQARYVNTDFNTLGSTSQVFRAYTNYIPSGGSYNQPTSAGDFKVLQWGDVEGGAGGSGNWAGQIVQNFYDDRMWFRRSYGTTWQAWREFIHDGNVGSFAMRTDASATNSVDVRAPTFYDSNNTGYYVDPNGNSFIYGLSINVGQEATGAANSSVQGLVMRGNYNSNTWAHKFHKFDNGNGVPLYLSRTFGDGAWTGVQGWGTGLSYLSQVFGSFGADSVYSPIFYDSDNTGFYLNPSSTGTSLNVAGNIIGVGELRTSGQITNANYMVGGSQSGAVNIGRNDLNYRWEGTSWGSTTTLGLLANCLDYWEFGIHDSGSKVVSPLYYDGGGRFLMGRDIGWGQTYIEAASSFRAPIFYDSNDTGYYIDPTGTSFTNVMRGFAYQSLYGGGQPAARWDCSFYVLQSQHWYSHNGASTMYIGESGDFVYIRGYTTAEGSSRSPIFYDSNDTAFYMNPNAGSRFQTIDVNDTIYSNNWFRSYGDSGWYNQSYGGGIFMQDTTWVRVYNGKAFYVPNEIAATGNITAYYSDERLKTKTGGIDNALEKVAGLSGFLYVENDLARSLGYTNAKQQVGVSAQAVQAVLPEAVSLAPVDFETLEDGTIISKSGENYLTVDYSRLVPLLIEAIKELRNEVTTLKTTLN